MFYLYTREYEIQELTNHNDTDSNSLQGKFVNSFLIGRFFLPFNYTANHNVCYIWCRPGSYYPEEENSSDELSPNESRRTEMHYTKPQGNIPGLEWFQAEKSQYQSP